MEANNRTLDLGYYTFRLEELPKYRFCSRGRLKVTRMICLVVQICMNYCRAVLCFALLVTLLAVLPARSQSVRGSIVGRVTDAAGNPSG